MIVMLSPPGSAVGADVVNYRVMTSVTVLERVQGECGELVLRRVDGHCEVIANGTFLMDTRNGESERLLVDTAAERLGTSGRVLIGGLGVGFSLRAALEQPNITETVVVEREGAVIEWNRSGGPLAEWHRDALAEPGVLVEHADLLEYLRDCAPFDAICLDVDNGPGWTVDDGNAALYEDSGLALVRARLRPGGVLAVWSAAAAPEFEDALRSLFPSVLVREVPVPRGEPDVIYLAELSD